MSSWPPEAPKDVVIRHDLELPPIEMARYSVEEYKKELKKKGWYFNNTGANSDVFLKQIKGQRVALKISVNDYGYDLFLERALKNQNNPFFPKILEVRRYLSSVQRKPYIPVRVTLVAMEALADSMETGEHASRLQRMAASMQGNSWWSGNLFQNVSGEELQATRIVSELFAELGSQDLHSDNVMMRKCQPVIIDPVVYLYNREVGYFHDGGSTL